MQDLMYELAEFMGFNYIPDTFPEFFTWIFLAISGTTILCCIIRMLLFMAFRSRKLVD